MLIPDLFNNLSLQNRLGQDVQLAVRHAQGFGREYVFVVAPTQQASSLVAKNAEHFAFQLRDIFNLDARRMELIEMRGDMDCLQLWRWRFEWVGHSPLSPRCEAVSATHQQSLLALLQIAQQPKVASA